MKVVIGELRNPLNMQKLKLAFFLFFIAISFSWSQSPFDIKTSEEVIIVGDLHGSLQPFEALLHKEQLIDGEKNWIGKRKILVLVGDLVGKGKRTRELLDLVMRLEKQAQASGGQIITLAGNHEVMWLQRDYRKITKAEALQFSDFFEDRPFEHDHSKRENNFNLLRRKLLEEENIKVTSLYHRLKKKLGAKKALKTVQGLDQALFHPQSPYGHWLASLPFAIKINGVLVFHADLDLRMLDMSLDEINKIFGHWLSFFQSYDVVIPPKHGEWLVDSGYSQKGALFTHNIADGNSKQAVKKVLTHFEASKVIFGHTPFNRVKRMYKGRVYMVDNNIYRKAAKPAIYGNSFQYLKVTPSGKAYIQEVEFLPSTFCLRNIFETPLNK